MSIAVARLVRGGYIQRRPDRRDGRCVGLTLTAEAAHELGVEQDVALRYSAELVAFLLSEKAGFFVGSVIFCDGGIDAAFRGKDWPAVWQV